MTVTDAIPLTSAQAGLWFGQTLAPDNATFNVCDAIEIPGEVNVDALARAARLAVSESDALTTRLIESGDGWRQVPGDHDLPLPTVVRTDDADPWPTIIAQVRGWTGTVHDLSVVPGVHQWIIAAPERTFWVLAVHHALIDAYGLSLVFNRGAALYAHLVAGTDDTAAPLGLIAEVVDGDLDYLASDAYATDAGFWAEHLDGAAETGVSGQADAVRTLRTPLPQIPGNWTVAVTAAVAAYLARVRGDTEISLGFLLMNRLGQPSARVPTVAVNLVPLRIATRPGDTVADIISGAGAAIRELSRHQRYRGRPVGTGPTLTGGFSRFAGTVVNAKPFAPSVRFAGRDAVQHSIERGPVQDFSVTVSPTRDGELSLLIDADADRYDEAALAGLAGDIARFLLTFTDPGSAEHKLAMLAVITAAEAEEAARLGRGGPNSGGPSMIETFDATVTANPSAVAIVAPDATWTFTELATRTEILARTLRGAGVRADDPVAIVADSSAATVAAILAVWRAHGAFVPIDPRYPADRVRHLLTDCGARAVLVTESTRDLAAQHLPADVTLIDLDTDDAGKFPEAPLPLGYPHPESSAYVIYTSGSTGLPKGVVIPHHAVSTLLGSHRHFTMPDHPIRILSTHTFSFDSAVVPLAWMCFGHHLYLIDRADVTDPDVVIGVIRDNRIDYVDAVPALQAEYVRAGLVNPPDGEHIPRWLSTGGEAFSPSLWTELTGNPAVTVFNLYGPTETTVEITFATVADTPEPSIGVPSRGADLHVLDRHLQPVAPAAEGELYIGSRQLARAYHHRPDLTAQRFVASPFAAGERLYRTGDLVRWNGFGQLDYLGRADDQVKVRGYRVELGEVESAVMTAARNLRIQVGAIVADVRASAGSPARLVAYLTGTGTTDFAALREEITRIAPSYIVPSAFVPIDAVPLSPAGKTDRRALPDPWRGQVPTPRPVSGDSPVAVLCGLIADILEVPAVDPGDDFFSLGGDSIISIQLTSRAREFGIVVSPRQVFELRTAQALADAATHTSSAAVTADPAQAVGEIPFTPLMHRVLRNGGPLDPFAQVRAYRIPSGASLIDLADTLDTLRRTHPMLRARLTDGGLVVDGSPADDAQTSVEIVDTPAGLDAVAAQSWAEQRITETAHLLRPHAGLMSRGLLIRDLPTRDGRTDAFVLLLHHLVVDGVSWRILGEDLRTAFDAVSRAAAPSLPAPTTSFREWSRGLVSRATDADVTAGTPLWEHPPATPGADDIVVSARPLDASVDTASAVDRFEVDLPTHDAIAAIPDLYRTGPTEVLLATLALAIARVYPEDGPRSRRLFVDLEGHGRDETLVDGVDLSRTVGWFTAFWPVPVRIPADTTPAGPAALVRSADTVIKQVKERLAAPMFGGLEYGLLTELAPGTQPQRPSGVLFNYLGRLTTGEGSGPFSAVWPGKPIIVVRDDAMPVSHPLEINAVTVAVDDELRLRVEISFVRTLIGRARAQRIVDEWSAILAALAAPDTFGELGGITPSDSLVDDLTQDEIDEFADEFA
ncbi:amino acid adenylation domain-containing protein/non-ribosomal peptide synthase protein (TIGR01720 family) [Gordonia amarae]|uniref:non-ribosomal peptide synthetase n=1 Tax=Gordonia amarae TaxID=36821 RepID=UPI001BCB97FF|nr:non-ribosomal peptide synthetase [Gordonia amarae]MCS3878257.1 amino acid adenylation domain-containing protein/non-ribosomal peptide synthase protein (TIGR01720 family) [Gordonia amarae]